jgi:PHD/YefM family antitoxin component YafN of YafNO toxin-antitoxin module
MVHRLPITQARINLGQLARRAHVDKEYFILEKDGIPVIGIMDAEELEDYLELRDPQVRRSIQRSRGEYGAGRSRPARELLAELQAGRREKPKAKTRRRSGG